MKKIIIFDIGLQKKYLDKRQLYFQRKPQEESVNWKAEFSKNFHKLFFEIEIAINLYFDFCNRFHCEILSTEN